MYCIYYIDKIDEFFKGAATGDETITKVAQYLIDAFDEAIKNLQRIGIEVIVHIIIGLPNETKEDLIETIHHLNHLKD